MTHDNSAHGIYLSGTTTGILVQGNTSYHNAYQYQRNANGINDISPGNTIIGNVTYSNEDSGINVYPGADNTIVADNVTYNNGDHGIDDLNVTGGRITGNTVYGNCTDGINVEGTSGNYVVEDNVAVNNATGAVINPTPIATNPSTGGPYYTNTCNRRTGNIGIYDSAPGLDHNGLQPRLANRPQEPGIPLGVLDIQHSAVAVRGQRPGATWPRRQPAVRQRGEWEIPALSRVSGHRLGRRLRAV